MPRRWEDVQLSFSRRGPDCFRVPDTDTSLLYLPIENQQYNFGGFLLGPRNPILILKAPTLCISLIKGSLDASCYSFCKHLAPKEISACLT